VGAEHASVFKVRNIHPGGAICQICNARKTRFGRGGMLMGWQARGMLIEPEGWVLRMCSRYGGDILHMHNSLRSTAECFGSTHLMKHDQCLQATETGRCMGLTSAWAVCWHQKESAQGAQLGALGLTKTGGGVSRSILLPLILMQA
jgi:hypothetical protein